MPKATFTNFFRLIALALVVAIGVAGYLVWQGMRPPTLGGDFTLTHLDQKWTFSQNARELNLLYIGYVKCPDICPMSLSNTGQAFKELTDDQRKRIQLDFISVDAAHDTPQSVSDYAKNFFPDFVGLTGADAEIQKAVDLFGASYMVEKDPKSYLGYSIAHTDRLFFLNKNGIVIDSIQSPHSAKEILTKIRGNL